MLAYYYDNELYMLVIIVNTKMTFHVNIREVD